MEILKYGINPEEIECKYKYKFKCYKCNTIFIADKTEIQKYLKMDDIISTMPHVVCPVCEKKIPKTIFTPKINMEKLELKRAKLLKKIEKFAEKHNDQKKQSEIYIICSNETHDKLHVEGIYSEGNFAGLYFTSREIAEEAIKKFGEKIIKNYLFRRIK